MDVQTDEASYATDVQCSYERKWEERNTQQRTKIYRIDKNRRIMTKKKQTFVSKSTRKIHASFHSVSNRQTEDIQDYRIALLKLVLRKYSIISKHK